MPSVSTTLAAHISHSSSASLTNFEFPVQVKPSVPTTASSKRLAPPVLLQHLVQETLKLTHTHISTSTRRCPIPLRGTHQSIRMSHNTNFPRRMITQARSGHNWSETQLNHCLLQLRLPRRRSTLVPYMALSSVSTMFLPSDNGSSEGNSMYTVLEISPQKKAFLRSNKSMRWFPGPCLPPTRALGQPIPGCSQWWGRSIQVITSLSVGPHLLRTLIHICTPIKFSSWIGFIDSSWNVMIDSAFFESVHLLLPRFYDETRV